MEYPWYELVEADQPLQQGDMIRSCPLVILPSSFHPENITSENPVMECQIQHFDIILMSHSCDLLHQKLDSVTVCPFWSLTDLGNRAEYFRRSGNKEELRKGRTVGYHLLNKCEITGYETDFLVVELKRVYGIPFEFLTQFAKNRGKRIRILPPYREHLSQAFARFFMRVGLPIDIPSFR